MSIDNKLDKIQEDVSKIETHLAVYNSQLKIHIKRSEQLEDRIVPIETHVAMIQGALKLLAVLATILAIAEAINHLK